MTEPKLPRACLGGHTNDVYAYPIATRRGGNGQTARAVCASILRLSTWPCGCVIRPLGRNDNVYAA
ncbi:MAG: hypothetical protein IJC15_09630 [Clostridia bacterium]|nr:hypothetical protein [Clostridia bacterium]